jgi:hypothetical protein
MNKIIFILIILVLNFTFIYATEYPPPFIIGGGQVEIPNCSVEEKAVFDDYAGKWVCRMLNPCSEYNIPEGGSLCIEEICPKGDQTKCYCKRYCYSNSGSDLVQAGNIQSNLQSYMGSGSSSSSVSTSGEVVSRDTNADRIWLNTTNTTKTTITEGNLPTVLADYNLSGELTGKVIFAKQLDSQEENLELKKKIKGLEEELNNPLITEIITKKVNGAKTNLTYCYDKETDTFIFLPNVKCENIKLKEKIILLEEEVNGKNYFIENKTLTEIPSENSITGNVVDDKQENIFNKLLNSLKNLF